jgi:hypothetical protein
MTIYYLYVKTHNKTGLKYLGYTKSNNPHTYTGSGKYWRSHINKHGYDVTTEILKESSSKQEIKEWGLYYSNLWNIVEEKDENGKKTWANLTEERGDGGKTTSAPWNKGKKATDEIKQKQKDAVLRRTDKTKQKMVESGKRSYEKTFALFTKEQRMENYKKGIGKITPEQRREIGRKSENKGGETWSKASSGKVTVTDKLGNSKRIPQQLYNDMKADMILNNIPMEDWEFVQVSSLESRRRRRNNGKKRSNTH